MNYDSIEALIKPICSKTSNISILTSNLVDIILEYPREAISISNLSILKSKIILQIIVITYINHDKAHEIACEIIKNVLES